MHPVVCIGCIFYTLFSKERWMFMKRKIRCAIYDRVSHELQVEKGLSLDTQKEMLTSYAKEQGYEIVDYYQDEGISARKTMKNRKELLRLLEDVKADKIDIILVTKLDRWFRSVKDYHNTQAILDAHHCAWKTILEDYDTTTSDGQLKINIMLAVAQNEADRTSERIKVVFSHKIRNKEHLNGPVPWGYMVDEKKHLVKDPEIAPIVEDMFNHYFTTFSKRETIMYIRSKYPGKTPEGNSLAKIFSNATYAGIRFGIENYCDAYLTWEQHKKIVESTTAKFYPATHPQQTYIFSGMLRCPHCGKMLSGYVRKAKKAGRTYEYPAYRCNKRYNKHSAPVKTEKIVEQYVLEFFEEELNRSIYDLELKEGLSKGEKTANVSVLQDELNRINIMFEKGRISLDYYDKRYEEIETQIKEATVSHSKELRARKEIRDGLDGNWKELYLQLDASHKRAFWKNIIKEILIDPETHELNGIIFF